MKNINMKNVAFAVILTLSTFIMFSQESDCNCRLVYDDLTEKIEYNYIGLAQMRISKKNLEYDKRKEEFKRKVVDIQPKDCSKFLQNFLEYFQDGHVFVYEQPKYSEKERIHYEKNIKNNLVDVNSILKALTFEKNRAKSNNRIDIIGKWTDGTSEIGIIKDDGYYKAHILSSKLKTVKPRELKAQFESSKRGFNDTYYSYNYAPRFVEGNIYKENTLLVLTGGTYLGKLESLSNRETNIINKEEINLPVIKKLDDKNTLFSIPSFLADYTKFIKVITDNIDLLSNTTNLIIDIRGNIGGNAIYFSFIDAYATHNLKGSQGLVLASKSTQEYFERLAKNSPETYQPIVESIQNNIGNIIDGPKYPDKQFPHFESKIENVAILTDNGTMSAAESFILHSKGASNKVKTFGSTTGGVIDYTSVNVLRLESGNQNIFFRYPTSTYHKNIPANGYNKTGIIPDIQIASNEADKVKFIINYYK